MVARNGHRTYAKTGSTIPLKTGSLVYSPARAAITYSHPYFTTRTVVCRRGLSVVSGEEKGNPEITTYEQPDER